MKNTIILTCIFASILMISTFQGCKKYPDGPVISVYSKKERVANTWKVNSYKINGMDYTSLVTDYIETFTKDENYYYTWGVLTGSGTWYFLNDDKEIQLNGINNQSSQTRIILKLEEKQFWYYYMDGNNKKEFHMVPEK